MPSSTTPFSIDSWEPQAVDEAADAPALGRVSFSKRYEGDDLTGTAVATMLTCDHIAYTAMERVTGTLAGRTGSFVLMHGAAGGTGEANVAAGVIVTGAGTGELAGLSGRMEIRHDEDGPRLLLEYELS